MPASSPCRAIALPLLFALCAPVHYSAAEVLRVGPNRDLKTPAAAARVARHGDTIEIDAGRYEDDYAVWHQDDLTIRGIGGMAHLHSNGLIPNGKGIWITNGKNTLIENVEFSGARVHSTNGAGIRHQGGDLTLRNTFFHDNEFSVLSGVNHQARIAVYDSRFWFQKRATRFSHGIYIGAAGRFTLSGSHFKGTDQGHHVKSRALENFIRYNRIEDVEGGNASRLIDLPNCGYSVVLGNDMHQAATAGNLNFIGYGMEGCEDRSERQKRLVVVHNTFVNEAPYGTLVSNATDGAVLVANNRLLGQATWLRGSGRQRDNVREDLPAWLRHGWTPGPDSPAVDAARPLGGAADLSPGLEFASPTGTAPRPVAGELDAGSRERPGGSRRGGGER